MTGAESEKTAARRAARARRAAANTAGHDAAAQARLAEFLAGHRGAVLAGYVPMKTEIDPLPVMRDWTEHAPVCVPVVSGPDRPLDFHAWSPEAEMTDGAQATRVPADGVARHPDIVLVPLLAFDRAGHRLGYGGGFYDRTLAALRATRATLAVGFAYADQGVERLPAAETDAPLDALVTERGVDTFPR